MQQLLKLKAQALALYHRYAQQVANYLDNLHPQARPILTKALKIAGWFFLGGLGVLLFMFLLVRLGAFGAIPSYDDLRKVQNPIASEVYDINGKILGRYYVQNRTNVSYGRIPESIVNALVATEDARFFEHSGIDLRSLFRVFFKSILLQNESAGGGSTISQQLAKNLFPRGSHGLFSMPVNKFKEMIIARRLEKIYTKNEVLELYLNTVSFGEDVYGIETATQRYFNTKPENLRIQDGAVLIGLLKATSAYNPRLNPERAVDRRNTVLSQMVRYDYLSKATYDSLKALPLELDYNYISQNTGLAPHFREQLRLELTKFCKETRKPDGSNYDLYTDGLKIYTTIDARLQKYAEEAVSEHMASLQKTFFDHWKNSPPWGKEDRFIRQAMKETNRYKVLKEAGWSEEEIEKNFKTPVLMRVFTYEGEIEKTISPWDSIAYYHHFLNTAFLAMNPKNGYVQAWVGSINYKYFQYDHVFAQRQVGSTFKPIVYAAAIENGQSPCDYFPNELISYDEYGGWTPHNADEVYGGYYSMVGALTNSVNTISVEIIMANEVSNARRLAQRMGVKSPIPNEPSIALGAVDISLYEMIKVYSTFANRGRPSDPVYLLRIEDRNGTVLKEFDTEQKNSYALSSENTDIMVRMMENVVNEGTASRLRYRYGLHQPIAGKTGTTQEQADGWFIGYTPNIVAGVWVGGMNRTVRFRSLSLGQGANTALPVWGLFMSKASKDDAFKNLQYGAFPADLDSNAVSMDCPLFVSSLSELNGLNFPPAENPPSDEEILYEILDEEEMERLNAINQKNAADLSEAEVEFLDDVNKKREKALKRIERKRKAKEFIDKVKEKLKGKKSEEPPPTEEEKKEEETPPNGEN